MPLSNRLGVLYGPNGEQVAGPAEQEEARKTSVTRSYSFKLSDQLYGGHQYESTDFFCSQTVTCFEHEVEDASLAVFTFARREVLKAVNERITELGGSHAQSRPASRRTA